MYSWVTKIWQLLGRERIFFYEDAILRKSFIVLLIQFFGLLLVFGSNILFARLYGEQVYGVYSLVFSWASILSVISLFGMDDVHLVRAPTLNLHKEKKSLKHLLSWSFKTNALSIFLVTAGFYFAIHFLPLGSLSMHADYFDFGLAIICFLTLLNNFLCFLRGIDRVITGEIIDKIIRPAAFIIFLVLFNYFLQSDKITKSILANSACLLVVSTIALIAIFKAIVNLPGNESDIKQNNSFLPNVRYTSLNLLYILSSRLDILILGLMAEPLLVGHYNVATRIADIFVYPISIINLSLPTLLAKEKHASGEKAGALLLFRIARNSFYQCLLLGVFFLLAGRWILGWYGKGFTDALPLLGIFLFSGLISAFTGSADVFFIMEKEEKKVLKCRIISLAITFAMTLALIPRYGTFGAAFSMLGGNFVYCFLIEILFLKQYGYFIHPFASKKTIVPKPEMQS